MSSFTATIEVKENGRKAPNYDFRGDLKGNVTLVEFLEFIRQTLIDTSIQVLAEEQSRGFDKEPVVTTDGVVGRSIFKVSPLGKIEFTSKQAGLDIVLNAFQAILERSPVDTGLYKSSHVVIHSGKVVANTIDTLKVWIESKPEIKPNDYVLIVNTQPYARRLERLGVTAGQGNFRTRSPRYRASRDQRQRSGPKVLAPNGAYFLASRAIKRKYKRNAQIKFRFVPGYVLGLKATFKKFSKASGTRKTSKSKPNTYLYPALTISFNQGGIL